MDVDHLATSWVKNRARPPRRPPGVRRLLTEHLGAVIGGAATVLAAIAAALIGLLASGSGGSPPPDRPLAQAPDPTGGPAGDATGGPGVEAKVVNSGRSGVLLYGGPSTERRYRGDGRLDGDVIRVVCQERAGQPVSDVDPAPGQPKTWPVWNKLDNGRWIPDLWTDLPKQPGATPPYGLPTCARPSPSG